MNHRAGFLIFWTIMLLQSSAAGSSCRPKELTDLIRSLLGKSLTSFDDANGKHLGTWYPGFAELQVHHNSPVHGPHVQCSLVFMAQGLKKVLEDQRNDLNPDDVSLHGQLSDIISRVNMLASCVENTLGWECSRKPSPPKLPKHVFERKQWGHTLLKASRDYLEWLKNTFGIKMSKLDQKNEIKQAQQSFYNKI